MYEGAPNWPERGPVLGDHREATGSRSSTPRPTAIRAFMKWGEQLPKAHDLSSLRLLGTVGEPINPEAWMWYHQVIGGERCPIVDTWWQTETGAIMITPLPGDTRPSPARRRGRFPGIVAEIVNKEGNRVGRTGAASWSIKQPWPSMLRTLYGDDERYGRQYWSDIPGVYFTGDGAGATRTATSGSWAASTTSSTSPATASRRWRSESPWSITTASPRPPWSAQPDDLKGKAIAAFVIVKTSELAHAKEDPAKFENGNR